MLESVAFVLRFVHLVCLFICLFACADHSRPPPTPPPPLFKQIVDCKCEAHMASMASPYDFKAPPLPPARIRLQEFDGKV